MYEFKTNYFAKISHIFLAYFSFVKLFFSVCHTNLFHYLKFNSTHHCGEILKRGIPIPILRVIAVVTRKPFMFIALNVVILYYYFAF